jgi:TraX protein
MASAAAPPASAPTSRDAAPGTAGDPPAAATQQVSATRSARAISCLADPLASGHDAAEGRASPRRAPSQHLKWLALIAMLIDHTGAVFFPEADALRLLGRLALPLFCWEVARGVERSRDPGTYLVRLALFAVIAQPAYALVFPGFLNVGFPLLLAGLAARAPGSWITRLAATTVAALLALRSGCDGLWLAPVLVLLARQCRSLTAYGIAASLIQAAYGLLHGWPVMLAAVLVVAPLCWCLASWPERWRLPAPRWLFYAVYPGHLLLFAALAWVLGTT